MSRNLALNWSHSGLDNDFALHGTVFPSTVNAATERVRPRSLRHEFDRLCLALFDLHATLRRGENQARARFRFAAICEGYDPKTVSVIGCGNFQLNSCSLLNANW